MSSAALAKKRRANAPPPPIDPRTTPSPTPNSTSPVGLTLPQVIALVDSRLTNLETFVKNLDGTSSNTSPNAISSDLIEDYESRFQMLATEITEMKDIVLKLQTFTMEVNKKLLEKVNVSSETFVLSEV
jgi:hypothetical protein